jgi:septation ring formation regulator EzrA
MASSTMQELPLAADELDLKALEDKVVRTVEMLGKLRTAKAKADEQIDNLKLDIMARDEQIEKMQKDLVALRKDREEARDRVERMISQIDTLIAAEVEA